MNEPFKGIETRHRASGARAESHTASPEIEQREQAKHAHDCYRAKQGYKHVLKPAPQTTDWLLNKVGLHVWKSAAPLDLTRLVKELLL
jgi:hypothetical protein